MYDRRPGFFREDTPAVPGRRVDATVKWFNASKGFGFVTMSDGTQDAFLPMAILRRAGYDDVQEGSLISCEVSAGAKGPLVTNVLNIDASTAAAPRAIAVLLSRLRMLVTSGPLAPALTSQLIEAPSRASS